MKKLKIDKLIEAADDEMLGVKDLEEAKEECEEELEKTRNPLKRRFLEKLIDVLATIEMSAAVSIAADKLKKLIM
jgi:hypothetical protein